MAASIAGVNHFIVKQVVNHRDREDVTDESYNQYDRDREKRQALAVWSSASRK
jgi:hypothetical protein